MGRYAKQKYCTVNCKKKKNIRTIYVKNKNSISTETLTVFLGGAGMVGEYNEDMIKAFAEAGIKNAHYGNYSSLPKGVDKYIHATLDNIADANAVIFYNQSPSDPVIVKYREGCKEIYYENGNPVAEEYEILFGLIKVKKYAKKTHNCDDADPNHFQITKNIKEPEYINLSLNELEIESSLPSGQFNLVGYSWGSVIVAQSALYHANKGITIDNLVLIGSPINLSLLEDVKNNRLIKNTTVLDLTMYGDPIYAGMTDEELIDSSVKLGVQMLDGVGHFYYSGNNKEGQQRRRKLAETLYAHGLR